MAARFHPGQRFPSSCCGHCQSSQFFWRIFSSRADNASGATSQPPSSASGMHEEATCLGFSVYETVNKQVLFMEWELQQHPSGAGPELPKSPTCPPPPQCKRMLILGRPKSPLRESLTLAAMCWNKFVKQLLMTPQTLTSRDKTPPPDIRKHTDYSYKAGFH